MGQSRTPKGISSTRSRDAVGSQYQARTLTQIDLETSRMPAPCWRIRRGAFSWQGGRITHALAEYLFSAHAGSRGRGDPLFTPLSSSWAHDLALILHEGGCGLSLTGFAATENQPPFKLAELARGQRREDHPFYRFQWRSARSEFAGVHILRPNCCTSAWDSAGYLDAACLRR